MRGQGIEYKIEGEDGIERSPTNATSQNKIQRKFGAGAASPKVIEENHRPVPHIAQHTRWESERYGSASAVGYMSVPLVYQGQRKHEPRKNASNRRIYIGCRWVGCDEGEGTSYEDAYNAAADAASTAPLFRTRQCRLTRAPPLVHRRFIAKRRRAALRAAASGRSKSKIDQRSHRKSRSMNTTTRSCAS
ncbi:hypothetical protein B0H13DRAFT_1934590 [Mycena leptocephala]|nr:hypothetical protein B0H13DRAFT_1934590 [Mycena leptocephala]